MVCERTTLTWKSITTTSDCIKPNQKVIYLCLPFLIYKMDRLLYALPASEAIIRIKRKKVQNFVPQDEWRVFKQSVIR